MTYYNRYNDAIEFSEDGNVITMSNIQYVRYGFEDDGTITMVDPSGGPYIDLGQDIGHFFMDGKNRVVKKIEVFDDHAKITVDAK